MKWVSLFCGLSYLILLVSLFFGYEPPNFTIGCAFVICIMCFVKIFFEYK